MTKTSTPINAKSAAILAAIKPGTVLRHIKRDWIIVTVKEIGEKSTTMENGTTEYNRFLGSYRIVEAR